VSVQKSRITSRTAKDRDGGAIGPISRADVEASFIYATVISAVWVRSPES
jgi:hypothetical protein